MEVCLGGQNIFEHLWLIRYYSSIVIYKGINQIKIYYFGACYEFLTIFDHFLAVIAPPMEGSRKSLKRCQPNYQMVLERSINLLRVLYHIWSCFGPAQGGIREVQHFFYVEIELVNKNLKGINLCKRLFKHDMNF